MSKDLLMDNVLKGLKEYLCGRAESLAEIDDDAKIYISEQEHLNSDIGGGWEFEELPNRIQEKLFEESKEDLLDDLEGVFGNDSQIYATFEYIIGNM